MFVQTPMVPSSEAKHYAMVQKDTTSGVTYVLKFYSYILNRASIFKWNWTSIQYYSMLHQELIRQSNQLLHYLHRNSCFRKKLSDWSEGSRLTVTPK